jgi:hypothetical protein
MSKITNAKRTEKLGLSVKCLPSKCEALSSTSQYYPKEKRKKERDLLPLKISQRVRR